jgi:Bax protein
MLQRTAITLSLFLLCGSVAAFELPSGEDLSTTANRTIAAKKELRPIPDFDKIKDPSIRKEAFINTILREARPVLYSLEKQRTILLGLYLRYRSGDPLSGDEQRWVLKLAHHMEVRDFDSEIHSSWISLIKRTDTIPLSLLIAQAAIESAWGTSRFAREGNNYFGIWCSTPGCGIVPKQRSEGATHEVERYSSLEKAIRKYVHILNTRSAFKQLRTLRHQQRVSLLSPTGTMLIKGLGRYAENGSVYMETLDKVIQQNQLGLYD